MAASSGIELRAGLLRNQSPRGSERERRTIDAVRDERVEDVRKRHDPRAERDLFPLEPVGIAAAVELLVMALDNRDQVRQVWRMQEHVRAVQRMSGDDQGLLARQRSRFPQQRVGDPDLADVVQQGAVLHAVQFHVAQPERARQLTREGADLAGVSVVMRTAGIGHAGRSSSVSW